MSSRVLHPFFFASFGVLFLYAISTATIAFENIATLFVLLVGAVIVLWVVLIPFIRDRYKRGLILTLSLFAYFFCVPISDLLSVVSSGFLSINLPYPLFCAVLILGVPVLGLGRRVIRTKRDLQDITRYMNVFAMCAVVMGLAQVGHQLMTGRVEIATIETVAVEGKETSRETLPDIYYIIMDGYVRSDVFSRTFGGDNSAFLDHLRAQGFYVAEASRSNYSQTYLSLASSLNSIHLTELAEQQGPASTNRRPLRYLVLNNGVVKFLKERGYTFVSFSSGYNGTEFKNADVYLEPEDSLSEFESFLSLAIPVPGIFSKVQRGHALHRERIEYVLDTLGALPNRAGPTFVFAHLLSPHPPFVFAADGAPKTPNGRFNFDDGDHYVNDETRQDYIEGYKAQLTYVTARLQETLDKILDRFPGAIIVVQGDHGSGLGLDHSSSSRTDVTERLSVLNAYHLPGGGDKWLYRDITPVNTFRVIFNHYFGTALEMLPDESYYATWRHPYRLENVTARAKKLSVED